MTPMAQIATSAGLTQNETRRRIRTLISEAMSIRALNAPRFVGHYESRWDDSPKTPDSKEYRADWLPQVTLRPSPRPKMPDAIGILMMNEGWAD